MPDHLYTIVARGHAIDAQTNALTLFHVVEQIQGELPFVLSELSLVTVWQRTPEDAGMTFDHRTGLVAPSGQEVFHFEQSFQMTKPRHRVLCVVQGIRFSESGCHRVEVQLRKADDGNWPAPVAAYSVDVEALTAEVKADLFAGEET